MRIAEHAGSDTLRTPLLPGFHAQLAEALVHAGPRGAPARVSTFPTAPASDTRGHILVVEDNTSNQLVAVGILGVASAASPLFLSSSSNGALRNAIGGFSCPWSVGYEVGINGPLVKRQGGLERFRDRNAALTSAVAPVPHLGQPVLTVVGSTVGVSRSGQPAGF